MGRNAAIKRYNARPEGQPIELWDEQHGRLPIVMELLKSPWIMRASDLLKRDGACATKRIDEVIEVIWDAERQCPIGFERNNKRYRVDGIIQVWASERSWWDRSRRVSRRFWRVLARGGVYDLSYDRLEKQWFLVGIQD